MEIELYLVPEDEEGKLMEKFLQKHNKKLCFWGLEKK